MNIDKIRKTIYVAFFVSISAQFHFDFLTEGFIVAMSTVVMAIFIYCYEDLTAMYIACLSGVFSPALRILTDVAGGAELLPTMKMVSPDIVYFFSYAFIYTCIYKLVIRAPKSPKNFPYALFFSDMLSNIVEMGVRSIQAHDNLYSTRVIAILAAIAFFRTVIIMMVVVAIDSYGKLLVNQERDREYRRLLTHASIVSRELHIMNKNVEEVEQVTKDAYDLYSRVKSLDVPTDIANSILSLAKNTHEIKGDYRNVLDVLNDVFLREIGREPLMISEIINLERDNVMAMARQKGYCAEIVTRIRADFQVRKAFQMMSVIRNLMTNALEAIGERKGRITVTVAVMEDREKPYRRLGDYEIRVRDNGPGISEEDMENIFMEGYSTKFDAVSGNIQRGLGLSLVKDYVENEFGGSISLDSQPGKYTEIALIIPSEVTAKQ